MRILFVHRNFPGQFRSLAPHLVARGHQVGVLTWAGNPNPQTLPHARYACQPARHAGLGASYAQYADLGACVAERAAELARRGDAPDVVLGILNWGETLFLREIWPEARHLSYAEFLYASRGLDAGFDPEFARDDLASRLRVTARRAHLLQAAVQADALLAPTEFQAATFPPELRSKMAVIHDGVDTGRCAPDPAARFRLPGGAWLAAGDEVVTFVNRNLEPYRGFHTFMRALPGVLAARPRAQVVLVGGEDPGYGAAPPDGRSWKQVMLQELDGRLDPARLHFTGRLPYAQFLALLRVSRVHAYLSYPFVLSWSLLEAMATGCVVIGSDTAPVRELIADGQTGRLVDFFDTEGWTRALIAALADPAGHAPLGRAARAHVIDHYDLHSRCLPRLVRFVESGGRDRAQGGA